MNPRVQAVIDRLREFEPTARQRRLATFIGYPLFALFVALLAFYWSVPRERVKDRLETALSADVMSGQPLAIGMDVAIGDLSLKLFTGLGFKATDIILRTRPVLPGEKPARYIIDDVRVRLGMLSTMFGRASYSFVAHALSGRVEGHVAGNADETKAEVELAKLVLTGVPGIQQAFGGLPVEGSVSGKLDVRVPKNLIANANGTIDVDIEDVAIGDGKAKLVVPGDAFMAAGITFPRIKLGKLSGQIVIEKGRARFEGVRVHSPDGDASLEGYVELHDPIGTSQMHAYLRFRPSEALAKREPTVEILNNALSGTAKRSDGYLGIQMTGPLAAMFYLPSKDPPFGVTVRGDAGGPAAGAGAMGSSAATTATPTPPPTFVPPPNSAPPQAQPEPVPPPNPGTMPPGGSGTPSAGGTMPPSYPGANPPPGSPPPTGGEIASPPPTTPTGTTIAPPPSLRTMRNEPLEAPATPPPARPNE
jgi:type II secretion system protein N